MYQYELPKYFPTADELPCSDDTPVDNELQELIPSLLKSILQIIWADRMDWFFGIDMGIYYDPDRPPLVPDGFLSLNVERFFDEELRLSYLLWEERVPPLLVLEVVSTTPGGEYTTKLDEYERMGVLYYVIYNPKRKRKPKLEIYKLVDSKYELQTANPLWMPEIGLGIGNERADYGGLTRDWLYWYDRDNQRYLTPSEQIELERQRSTVASQKAELESQRADTESQRADTESQRAKLERDRADRLAAQLRALGIEPEVP
jgi:Uma2 family endonuclease